MPWVTKEHFTESGKTDLLLTVSGRGSVKCAQCNSTLIKWTKDYWTTEELLQETLKHGSESPKCLNKIGLPTNG